MKIAIQTNGNARYVDPAAESLIDQKSAARRRQSRVEPQDRILRVFFRAIRFLCGDRGRIAAWTRRWRCLWMARIFGGPTAGPFADRAEAIEWEISWIEENVL